MAREQPNSGGGKDLASLVYDFMKNNQDIMVKDSINRNADQNEKIGLEDTARAIAYGVEEALKQKFQAIINGTGLQFAVTGTMSIATVGVPTAVAGTLIMTGGGTNDVARVTGLTYDFNK